MNLDELNAFLVDPNVADSWLRDCGVVDTRAGHTAFMSMVEQGLTLDLLSELSHQLAVCLPLLSDPDLGLCTLARFVAATRNPLSFGSLIEQEDESLPILMTLFSTSEMLGDMLVKDPAAYDLLRLTEGATVDRQHLVEELCGEVAILEDTEDVLALLRRFKRRELLRIAYGDIVCNQSSTVVTGQLSLLAEAVCEAALQFAYRQTAAKRGTPTHGKGELAKLVMIGLRRFGGEELDYNSELDVLFLYDHPGRTNGERSVDNHDFFSTVARQTIKLLGDETEAGIAYRLNTQRATGFNNDEPCGDIGSAIRHFDARGRTWERLALIKARPVAGALDAGLELLDAIEPWIYRRYLSRSDISGIRALKRRLVRRSDRHGLQMLDVEGGVLDVEFAVQFLQLINGGDDRQIRKGNTFRAIGLLEQNGAITSEEASTLETNYEWLRRIEHRLEFTNNANATMLPDRSDDLRRLALRCGYDGDDALDAFQADYDARITANQAVTTRLLTDAFEEEVLQVDAETDLVMDPDPRPESIRNILSPYGFRDATDAYHNLNALGSERIPFLSTRRCRYFLSLISRPLLWAISKTPTPDATLANLVRVSDSLGGKGVLWELFHSHRPSLDLYVRLCSSSPYLTAILTRYPGMIDELMDSLMLAELPTLADMQTTLDDLCRDGMETDELDWILHSFKNTQHLNVGVRELLGKVDIRDSTGTLSDVAEACLQRIAHDEYRRLIRKLGEPRVADQPCGMVVLGMGKLGGREPNYHSDLDFVVMYEADGETYHPPTIRHRETTSNQHFFGELAKRMVKAVSENRKQGKLYDSNPQLRPIGKSGPVSVSLERFREFYLAGPHAFGEVRELCRARPVYGPEPVRARAITIMQEILVGMQVTELDSTAVRHARRDLQENAGPRNLKRGPGGTLDVEFLTQALQLRHGRELPQLLSPNTLIALTQLAEQQIIAREASEQLIEGYRFLRRVEAMLRLLNATARHDLPREGDELAKLAYLMQFKHEGQLERECAKFTKLNRKLFDELI